MRIFILYWYKLARLSENGRLILFLEGAFSLVLTRSYRDGIQKSGYGSPQLSFDYMLIYALVLSLAFKDESTLSRQIYHQLIEDLKGRLERAVKSAQKPQIRQLISEIKNNLMNFIDDNFQNNWNEKVGGINSEIEILSLEKVSQFIKFWSQSLRKFMIDNCDIGHDWEFSDSQIKILREYYYANVTLAQCLNGSTKVSSKFRQEIEGTMILPITEIEKRKCKENRANNLQ